MTFRYSYIKKGKNIMREKQEAIEIICPKCKYTSIIYSPREDIPKCTDCKRQMVIRELLDEGKSY